LIFPSSIPFNLGEGNASGPNSNFSIRQSHKQTSTFLFQRGQQLVQRMRERGEAIGQQFLCDCAQIDTEFGQAS
jgi:hypothetical protein